GGIEAPALPDPASLLLEALPAAAVEGCAGVVERESGLEPAWPSRQRAGVAVAGGTGEAALLEALQRGQELGRWRGTVAKLEGAEVRDGRADGLAGNIDAGRDGLP